jgi:hypothetical protein
MSKTISFKGKLANGDEDRIRLKTLKGKIGYKITKFQVIGSSPAGITIEAVVKIYKKSKVPDFIIDFTDSDLLAAVFYENHQNVVADGENVIIFDNEMFNQDIYINCSTIADDINYYIELETMPISDLEATKLTLQSIRTITSR